MLAANPDTVLQFRSHSFKDSAVRRYFLQRSVRGHCATNLTTPLLFHRQRRWRLRRIHLHLDSSPVSGTTTTLDSLAMGIPVLTCPTPYYAGAISAAILQHAGLDDHVCSDPAQLPTHASWLAGVIAALLPEGLWRSRCDSHQFVMINRCRVCSFINPANAASSIECLIFKVMAPCCNYLTD